ncbi:MAG TPA: universal stress protein [Thermodesulfobacteriota bacterium]|nr:universal stress protein [Thermodesulfobacteriota bacterium]
MNINKILWPTDGSKESEGSLRFALYLSRIYGSEIICLHVSGIQIPLTDLYPSYESVIMDIVKDTEERFGKEFKRIETENPGVRFSTEVVRGSVVDWIIEKAKTDTADLIVMGKKGHGLIGSALLGSNTLKVLRNSPVPVLSVKTEGGKAEYDIKKILVPLDISDTADSSLVYALGLAGKLGAAVTVVYVFWIDANVYELSPELVDELSGHSAKELGQRVDGVRDRYYKENKGAPEAEIETHVLTGVSPALTITDYADENGFDLIAITTHGRRGFERIILGSETEKIIREARCPVLVLKP